MKKILLILAIIFAYNFAFSQTNLLDEDFELSTSKKESPELSLDFELVNQYIWRGQFLGHVSIQHCVNFDYKGLYAYVWGSKSFIKTDEDEIDFAIGYALEHFNVGIVDYFTTESNKNFIGDDLHSFEGNIGCNFGPIDLQWNSVIDDEVSSYFSIAGNMELKDFEIELSCGMVPWKTEYYNVEKFSVVSLGLQVGRSVTINDHLELPFYLKLEVNPTSNQAYVIGSLRFNIH